MVTNKQRAKRIVTAILEDLTNRGGLRQEWDAIDTDIQEEIIQAWEKLVYAELFISGIVDNS